MYKGKTVSVVFGTYKEKRTIRSVIDGFFKTGFVDEIVVVNNNAEKGTNEEVKKTLMSKSGKVRLVYENRQGYGWAYQKALKEAKGDYIVATEADGSFSPKDLEKFLVYANDYDVILGSRTSLIPSLSPGMRDTRKFGNVLEAKTIEVLFNTNALTDVGSTYKLFRREALNKIKKQFKYTSALFNTELILLVVTNKINFVEIPVTYKKRVGKSNIVGSLPLELKWAFIIQTYIFTTWIKYYFKIK